MARDYGLIESMWFSANILDEKKAMAHTAAAFILTNKSIYAQVGDAFGVPFYVIGAIHFRESSFDFKTHLANGDPLFNSDGKPIPTSHVPRGLGPFDSWVAGAIGALKHMSWGSGWHWDIANALENMEIYNGLGYYHMGVPSPYIWAGTDQYVGGLYVADGQYDPNAFDDRVGCAAILLSIKSLGVDVNDQGQPLVSA